ncbi:hypothetical protein C7H19_24600 [Aphanothece hegewaldii CCALA 016]|uniref:Uncharacterized protein n=1 Tax=Aphanothece hegewaldii CCALA 016 TaxID=2107694 RepID=A0A2T1LQN2_9CHRO|nr:hypothetical protein [Aphanothece hegewaldii]PSF28553.1 hypothetical protein C7H19_24600 [Aphanothece hegewaldii CCALA 016]
MNTKEHFPAGDMVLPWASLACGAKNAIGIDPDNLILNSLWLELYSATQLAETYGKIWHSIVWIRTKTATKKRVAATLNRIAFSINQHLEGAIELFNEFCDSQAEAGIDPAQMPPEFFELKRNIYLAQKGLKEFHREEIESCQLHFWEDI